MEGSELKDPSGRIRTEGSKRRELSRGNRADGSEQRNPSERIREEGYERKGGWIRAEGSDMS